MCVLSCLEGRVYSCERVRVIDETLEIFNRLDIDIFDIGIRTLGNS